MRPGEVEKKLVGKVYFITGPDIVLAQGDTTTVMTTALACFYRHIAFGHVEAGLRTGDIYNPFPEEMNRVVAGHLTSLHFAPTESSKQNLLRENIPDERIHVTGNTVIDALLETAKRDFDIGIATGAGLYLLENEWSEFIVHTVNDTIGYHTLDIKKDEHGNVIMLVIDNHWGNNTGYIKIFRINPSFVATLCYTLNTHGSGWRGFLADFNSDGYLDFVFGHPHPIFVYLNDSDYLSFTQVYSFSLPYGSVDAISVVDFDRDGDLDVSLKERADDLKGSLTKLTVKELKAQLKEAGLPIDGKKAELIERLLTKGDDE